MNAELQGLVLALEAVNEAGAGEDAKDEEALFKSRMNDVLERRPGLEYGRLKRAVELAHARWVKAQKRFPSV